MPCYHHLADTFAGFDGLRLAAEVDEDDAHLAAIVGIDGTGCVEYGQSAFEGETAARTYLRLITRRQFDEQTCRNQSALHRLQRNRLVDMASDIHTGCLRALVTRQRVVTLIDNLQ